MVNFGASDNLPPLASRNRGSGPMIGSTLAPRRALELLEGLNLARPSVCFAVAAWAGASACGTARTVFGTETPADC